MRDTVILALTKDDAVEKVAAELDADIMPYSDDAFRIAFEKYRKIVAFMAMGIVVRKIAPLISDKWTDPSVVVVSPDLKYSVPVLGGHHGANEVAKRLAGLGIRPVLTTATEAQGLESVEVIASKLDRDIINRDSTREVNAAMLRSSVPIYKIDPPGLVIAGPGVSVLLRKGDYIMGLGCRKGIKADEVVGAIQSAISESGIPLSNIMAFATTDKKITETGLVDGVGKVGGNLVFIDSETINSQKIRTPSRASMIGLLAVAEPSALAISRMKELVMERKIYGNITVAIAR